MARQIARYSVTFGLAGCYMPDVTWGPHACSTRGELAELIRSMLRSHEMPARLFREVGIRRLWGFIRRNGSSVAHFSLQHGGYSLAFHGLTEAEAEAMEGEDE